MEESSITMSGCYVIYEPKNRITTFDPHIIQIA